MAKHQPLLKASAVSLILISGATLLTSGHAEQIPLIDDDAVQVRADEEERIASLDKNYAKQQRKLATDYTKLAKLVEKQGGDPTLLLKAADYFESKADKQEEKEDKKNK